MFIGLIKMGKGGGCVPSKKRAPLVVSDHGLPPPPPPPQPHSTTHTEDRDGSVILEEEEEETQSLTNEQTSLPLQLPSSRDKLKLFIVFYSMYGHVEGLAKRIKKGVDGIDGVEGLLFRVPETSSDELLEMMHAPEKDDQIPVISAGDLVMADGFLFGSPTRFGSLATQMKSFFDSTGQLWKEQKLAGKPAGFFVSTGTQGGGQETTAWTAITQLAHHGMLFVPIGYTFGAGMFKMDSIRGGCPYGAGVYAGDGSREPSEAELAIAEYQGQYMAGIVKRLAQA